MEYGEQFRTKLQKFLACMSDDFANNSIYKIFNDGSRRSDNLETNFKAVVISLFLKFKIKCFNV